MIYSIRSNTDLRAPKSEMEKDAFVVKKKNVSYKISHLSILTNSSGHDP